MRLLLILTLLTLPLFSQESERLARIETKLDGIAENLEKLVGDQESMNRTIYGYESQPGLKSQIELNTQFRMRAEKIVLSLILLIVANVGTLGFQAIRYYQTRKDMEHGPPQ